MVTFSFHCPKDKTEVHDLLVGLKKDRNLSSFIILAIESNLESLAKISLSDSERHSKYWKKIIKIIREREKEEQNNISDGFKMKCKVVEKNLEHMVFYNRTHPNYKNEYGIVVDQIEDEGGPKITPDKLKGFYERLMNNESVDLIEELRE